MALLALLDRRPSHGFALKQSYDAILGQERDVKAGQVYATLARLERDSLARGVGVVPGGGPDRKMYAITEAGVAELEAWLLAPAEQAGRPGPLFTKVVLALAAGHDPAVLLDRQRAAYVARSRALLNESAGGDVVDGLVHDYEIAHLEADLHWIEVAGARLGALRQLVEHALPTADPAPSGGRQGADRG